MNCMKCMEKTIIFGIVIQIKNVDLNSVQKGVTNLQKTIGLLQDIGIGSKAKEEVYQPRPLYKYFDD